MKKRIIHYVRVSTVQQKTDRQENTIVMGAEKYTDKCSGSTAFKDRDYGRALLDEVGEGMIKEVHVHSIDRLGRNNLDIMNTIEFMTNNGVNVISTKEGLRTLNDDGTPNPIAKLMIGILGTLAEFELYRINERTAEGRAIAKERGAFKGNGRSKGEGLITDKELLKKYSKTVLRELKKGESIRRTAKICSVSTATVQKVKKVATDLGVLK